MTTPPAASNPEAPGTAPGALGIQLFMYCTAPNEDTGRPYDWGALWAWTFAEAHEMVCRRLADMWIATEVEFTIIQCVNPVYTGVCLDGEDQKSEYDPTQWLPNGIENIP